MADILPFGQPKDYPEGTRFVRPMRPTTIERVFAERGQRFEIKDFVRRPDLYRSLAEQDRIANVRRARRWQPLGGLAFMLIVAAFIGALLAVGGW